SLDSVLAGFTADFDGVSVPVGSAVDIGAFEYTTSASPPTPTPTATATPATTPTPTPTSTPTSDTIAADQFSRAVTDGWGSADTGGAYSLEGETSDFNVNGSAGAMLLRGAGITRTAYLP